MAQIVLYFLNHAMKRRKPIMILNTYHFHQESPIMVRNAPPVAGAIYWSRQLLKRIEDPMKIFRDNKAVTSLADFGRQVKTIYQCLLCINNFLCCANSPSFLLQSQNA